MLPLETYLRICEQTGEEPDPKKMPPDRSEFPKEVQEAFFIHDLLPDRWEGMSGSYLGKDYSALGDILETAFYNHQDGCQEKYARAYERKIRGFNSLTKTFIESCDYIWHSDAQINQNIGYYGLKLLQNMPWLKKQCIQHALYGLAEE